MTRRLIRAEIEAQASKRWADFILQQGEFAGPRDSYPPKPKPVMADQPKPQMLDRSPIASRHIAETGETVLETARRYRAQGVRISTAAARIGFAHGGALRDYMRRSGQECPWPSRRKAQPISAPTIAAPPCPAHPSSSP
jgi:hypothetical protein